MIMANPMCICYRFTIDPLCSVLSLPERVYASLLTVVKIYVSCLKCCVRSICRTFCSICHTFRSICRTGNVVLALAMYTGGGVAYE